MSDGAHLGIGAEDAMKLIIAGTEEEVREANASPQRTPDELRAHIEAHASPNSYEGTANATVLLLLQFYEEYPGSVDWPAERPLIGWERTDTGARHMDATIPEEWHKISFSALKGIYADVPDLYSELKAWATLHDRTLILETLTGFQWGWAVNAARYCFDLPSQPNPAIMTIE